MIAAQAASTRYCPVPRSRDMTLEPAFRLACAPGVGPAAVDSLLHEFGTVERILAAGPEDIEAVLPSSRAYGAIHSECTRLKARRRIRAIRALGLRAYVRGRPDYPRKLGDFGRAPTLLFARGSLPPQGLSVAIVGSRRPSGEGAAVAREWAFELARAGAIVVSGLARGIDGAAHEGALAGGGLTVAVLGSGPDIMYPREHEDLAARMVENGGAVVSQFWPGMRPHKNLFPARNHVIAGLADAVVVVEAAGKSGALYTARYAAQANRPVLVVPGPLSRASSAGSNALLKGAARPALDVSDVFACLELRRAPRVESVPPELPPDEASLYGHLDLEGRHADDLAAALGWAPERLLSVALVLELKGLVSHLPGKRFARSR